jgi:DNA-binding SARP family transcriptional activator
MTNRGWLDVHLLGELRLLDREGRPIALPASRKTRALLGYLIATARAHRRERLCDLFWDGPDDPRAELRWSLSKIRPLLAGAARNRLEADRDRVAIALDDAAVDLRTVEALVGSEPATAPIESLQRAAMFLEGEFLDGLDLPRCFHYQEWCLAERERVSRLRIALLGALTDRLQAPPAEALVHARALARADPLSERGHAAVVRLLAREGRSREAYDHYDLARRLFERELGASPHAELEEARRNLQRTTPRAGPGTRATTVPAAGSGAAPSAFAVALVGRDAEQVLIEAWIDGSEPRAGLVLLTGEPGIGKSRTLDLVGDRMSAIGGRAFGARAYEAETARPYGIWIDLLRTMTRTPSDARLASGPAPLPAELALLLPEAAPPPTGATDRSRIFDALLDWLRRVAAAQRSALLFDDIQWIDEDSAALLHYVARNAETMPGLIVVGAARDGEIGDNAGVARMLRSLLRERRLHQRALLPLDAAQTATLVRQVDPGLDAADICARSGGNPLFTLELARARARGDAGPGPTVEALIEWRLASLTEPARDALVWAAAYGGAFSARQLEDAARWPAAELVAALGELERRGLVVPIAADVWDFGHDLVRQTAYRTISQPRRRLLHRQIAAALQATLEADDAAAADLARHAALAEDHDRAARACLAAGDRALRLFANFEAVGFAERGLKHCGRLSEPATKAELELALLRVRILAAAGPGMRPLPPLMATVTAATRAAEQSGLGAAAATGHYLLSVLHQEAGDTLQAARSTLRAAAAGRASDEATRANQLANTARCLLELESRTEQARRLIAEADAISSALGLESCELHWARGLLQRWDGDMAGAICSIDSALTLARRAEDRWREYKCLSWLAVLEQELGRFAQMQARCDQLRSVASRLGEEGSPLTDTLRALAEMATTGASNTEALAKALAQLRAVDDKSYLAYALNRAAQLHWRARRVELARSCAAEALAVASIIRRRNEIAIARAMLAHGDNAASERAIEAVAAMTADDLSARARSTLDELAWPPPVFPTTIPTTPREP